jgi:hypothetical protein
MAEQAISVYVCRKDEWTLIPTPFGENPDARQCASEEKLLRAKHPEFAKYPTVIRAKGDGGVKPELGRIAWVPHNSDGIPLKLQVALMNGQSVVAHSEFERSFGW